MIRRRNEGFSLVEMVVVIAIIALLVGLLMSALQAARESARFTHCRNNLRQIAMGCMQHEASQGFLPAPGWQGDATRSYTGHAAYGFAHQQPGGWLYNILPYVGQKSLWAAGGSLPPNSSSAAARPRLRERVKTSLSTYVCPGRSNPMVPTSRVFVLPTTLGGIDKYDINTSALEADKVKNMARSDYAASREQTGLGALDTGGTGGRLLASIEDGLGHVFLCGERYLHPTSYNSSANDWNDGGWTVGNERDTISFVNLAPRVVTDPEVDPGSGMWYFGGPHTTLPMAMCDASVRNVHYAISPDLFRKLGTVNDGEGTFEDIGD